MGVFVFSADNGGSFKPYSRVVRGKREGAEISKSLLGIHPF